MKFIKVETTGGNEVFINKNEIVTILCPFTDKSLGSQITLSNGDEIVINEDMQTFMRRYYIEQ